MDFAELAPLTEQSDSISLTQPITVIGRNSDFCDIVLKDGHVSKVHCMVARIEGGFRIRDLGSTNGTRVDGQKIRDAPLGEGDLVQFEKLSFRFQRPGENNPDTADFTLNLPDQPNRPVDARETMAESEWNELSGPNASRLAGCEMVGAGSENRDP